MNEVAPDAGGGGSRSGLERVALTFVRAHVIALGVVLGLVLLYTIVGFFVVPRVARSQIESFVGELHKKVWTGEIRFNPFFLDLSVAGLRLTQPNDEPLVAFRHLYVNAALASVWQRGLVLQEVELSGPDIQVVVARDGSVNFASLAPAPGPPGKAEEPPARVRIGRLAVTDGRVRLADYTRPRPFTAAVMPIRFTLTDFRTDTGHENAYHFAGTTTAGEQLDWSGRFTVQPLGSTGQFSVEGLKLATLDSYLQDTLPFRIAGEATLDGHYDVRINPLALEVTLPAIAVRDATVAERGSSAPAPIALPALDVRQLVYSYGKREIGVREIELDGARVNVAREPDGAISLMRLFGERQAQRQGAAPAAAAAAGTKAGPTLGATAKPPTETSDNESEVNVHVDTIRLADASVIAEDRTLEPTVRVELAPIALTLKNWSSDPHAKLGVDADVTIMKTGRFVGRGDVQLEPLGARLAVDATDIELPVVQPYVARLAALTLHSGRLSAKGELTCEGMPESAPPLKFTGDVRIADLRTTDHLVNEDFVKWRDLAVTGITFQQKPDKLTIERIVARQPYAKVVIAPDATLNVAQVLSPARSTEDGARTAGDTGKDAPTMPIRIRHVQVIDGSANFADHSIQPSFATGILELNGKVSGLSSDPASRARVELQGKVDKYAPVDIVGETNILAPAKYADVAMNFRNMELTTFNPYSGKFAGYNISRGKLSTELQYHVEDRKLQARHHLIVDNLEFGAKTDSKDAAPIPVKLAVALLKDRHGVIDVQLPVSGTLDDPQFRLGPIIWKAILGLMTKIVTAPFAALGALFGGGEELAYVDFAPGSAALAPGDVEKLQKLSKALVERPQLRLNVPLSAVGPQDTEVLARQSLAAQLPQGMSEPPATDGDRRKRIKALEGVYQKVLEAPPEYPAELRAGAKDADLDGQIDYLQRTIAAKMPPDPAALDALGQRRAHAVQDALLANTELDPQRVFITSEHADTKRDGGQSRLEMKLE